MKTTLSLLLLFLVLPLFGERLIITSTGNYTLQSYDEGVAINVNDTSATVNLTFPENNSGTTVSYLIEGPYKQGVAPEGLIIINGNVILTIPQNVIVRLSSATTTNENYYGAGIGLGGGTSLTVRGEGSLIVYGHKGESAITVPNNYTDASVNHGTLTIEGNVSVYLSVADDISAISRLENVMINGGRVYCVPNHALPGKDYLTSDNPANWAGTSTQPPISASNVTLAGGALLGRPLLDLGKLANPQGLVTYSGAIANFAHTGGSYLTSSSQFYTLPEGYSTLPGACVTFNGTDSCTGEFFPALGHRSIYRPSDAQFRYQSESMKAAKTYFNLPEVPSSSGMVVNYDFGILGIKPVTSDDKTVVQLTVGVHLPNADTDTTAKSFTLAITESENKTVTGTDSNTYTFTRQGDSDLFTTVVTTPFDFNASSTRTYSVAVTGAN